MRKIKILDLLIEVEESSPGLWIDGAMGRTHLLESKIVLNSSLKKDLKDSTLIHEVLHLVSDIQGTGLTEERVTAVATGFYSFLMNNKEEVESLYEE